MLIINNSTLAFQDESRVFDDTWKFPIILENFRVSTLHDDKSNNENRASES